MLRLNSNLLLIGCAIFLLWNCQSSKMPENTITKAEAIEICQSILQEETDWSNQEISFEAKKRKEGFEVTAWRIPKTPGGFKRYLISFQGKLISSSKGK